MSVLSKPSQAASSPRQRTGHGVPTAYRRHRQACAQKGPIETSSISEPSERWGGRAADMRSRPHRRIARADSNVSTMPEARHSAADPDHPAGASSARDVRVPLTQADFDALVRELESLQRQLRSDFAGRLREARAFGGSTENDDLLAARSTTRDWPISRSSCSSHRLWRALPVMAAPGSDRPCGWRTALVAQASTS